MSTPSVLIFDRDANSGSSLRDLLATWGYEPIVADDLPAALRALDELKPTLILDGGSADDAPLVQQIREQNVELDVVPLERPVDPSRLRVAIDRAIELSLARKENERLRRELQDRGAFGELVGNSDSIRKIYTLIEQVAPSSASVLITGESGTGKELVARTIHKMSPRRERPFVAINCSAIPESLMESELFGHEKGSFTGAASRRQGCFELADTGTLLLDEIGEMPPLLQAKLLRVIEERAVRRLGGRKEIEVDVRLLAATNRLPHQAVDEGKLRSDLLYRLNVFSIHLPSLGERKEDLPLLAQHLVTQLAAKHGRPARFLSPSALQALQFHAWPGNVRELRNVVERAVIICSGEQIERHHFAPYPIEQRERLRNEDTLAVPVGTPLEEVERQMIMRTLQKTKNNKTRAAELLGISLKTLHNKLNLYRERGLLHDE
ncbi:MAG TPA: sigma-54 dependent transcriptional regulator [Pyrinomonadaceae bacterium]|jgi:DNA-binding NtrC family response regulator|nr:sigma-54 dependent transcriptional regulator [Pyrinomonadaceae bacterium]